MRHNQQLNNIVSGSEDCQHIPSFSCCLSPSPIPSLSLSYASTYSSSFSPFLSFRTLPPPFCFPLPFLFFRSVSPCRSSSCFPVPFLLFCLSLLIRPPLPFTHLPFYAISHLSSNSISPSHFLFPPSLPLYFSSSTCHSLLPTHPLFLYPFHLPLSLPLPSRLSFFFSPLSTLTPFFPLSRGRRCSKIVKAANFLVKFA